MSEYLAGKTRIQSVLESEVAFDIGAAAFALLVGIPATVRYMEQEIPDYQMASTAGVGTAGVFCVTLARGIYKYRKHRKRSEPHPLDVVLTSLHSILTEGVGKQVDDPGLRLCVIVQDRTDPHSNIQRTNYAGNCESSGQGRKLNRRCEVVALAFEEGKAVFDQLPANTNMIDYVVKKHRFTREETARLTPDRKSWAAIPVGLPGNVVAVVYADSREKAFFGNKDSQRRKVLESSALGVAEHIGAR